ncbi:uncharacterized protein LOC118645475 isoform X3 [Monomorium pharaonis]|uniref:uncharacterized protein LOC118645475 isoform X3 n=1 Tax=Monomorium pharaonis TaxID=307658 RepID=UPI00174796C1|nr:uncharacterized protein LOC118645475 isoform X3 [Monomorium pharaonis]
MSWNDDIAYAMTPYKVFTLPLGVWPLQKYNMFSLFRSIVCGISLVRSQFSYYTFQHNFSATCIFNICDESNEIAMIIMLFLEINFGSSDAYVKLDDFMLMNYAIICILKILSFRLYADNMIRNFSSAVKDYLAIDNEGTRIIMRRHAFMGRIICFNIVFCTYLTSAFFFLLPIIAGEGEDIQINVTIKNQGAELPVPITFLGDIHIPTILYFVISTMQLFMLMFIGTSNCGNDSLFLGIVLHICGQIEVLKVELFKYGTKSKNLSFQFILALKANDAVMIIKTIAMLFTMLLQLFFYSFVGDYLKCQMEDVADSIYSCKWYSLQTNLMKNVVFVIMRSQQPVQLLAGNFFVVNLKTFMTILKSSLSYLSVLRVMMDT